jgi:hypothetical protein
VPPLDWPFPGRRRRPPRQRRKRRGSAVEGFELAEEELVEAAQHGESDADPLADAFTTEAEGEHAIGEHGEADHEDSSEAPGSDR